MYATAAVMPGKGSLFELREVVLDEPRPDEVVVRVVASGICHTDLIVRDQWYPPEPPVVLGHEGAGVVERVGSDVASVRPGDRVAMSFAFCRGCRNCLLGRPAYCTDFFPRNFGGRRADGSATVRASDGSEINANFFGQSSFSTYVLAAEHTVVPLPNDLPLELAAPLGCGVQTGAGAVLNSLAPPAGGSIVVFGVGTVGLSAIMAADVAHCDPVIAVDLVPKRLALAAELGATHTFNGTTGGLAERIMEIAGGGIDFAVETTASPAVLRTAVDSLAFGGTCGVIGAAPIGTEVSLDMSALLFDRSVRGIVEGGSVPRLFIPRLIDLHRRGRFPFDRLIRTYPFEEINRAAEDSEKGVTVKPVVLM
ncbi:NAD(P)-dependent alcohol dehydrogenase [Actinoallomurus purpureus]|uniref:NAD(P)-dependent alcohol dehydrogenase n=1 Tax=Actinoallomurus purpureus TaxID=478114 RepID=UPI0020937FF7|nr:NAD(P)-dependent alcohol dehydrogenase [Actinoallomurus purpureus]MCO6005511.1 NAD(P)-dependent alcohol dehydrogenase [Actinoallomurus purpureus]